MAKLLMDRPTSPSSSRSAWGRSGFVGFLALAALGGHATAQPVTDHTPNIQGTWVTSPWNLNFSFSHRFETAGDGDIFGDAKIVNYPTFELDLGLFSGVMVGVRYSSNARGQSQPNEWQPLVKFSPLRGAGNGKLSLALLGAYNGAAKSFDAEISGQTTFGPLLVLGAVRGFTDPFNEPEEVDAESLALAGGLGIKINRYLTVGADVGKMVAGLDTLTTAWSGGVGIGIPLTPHTFSIFATNVTSGTLEGVSAGVKSQVFWGFEFTIPFSGFARWGRIIKPDEVASGAVSEEEMDGKAVEIEISRFRFEPQVLRIPPGTTVRWVNKDPVGHTATSDDESWGSPLLGPSETFSYTFEEEGEFPYHCIPHPFMTGTIVVTSEP